jgi:hypothetical protein
MLKRDKSSLMAGIGNLKKWNDLFPLPLLKIIGPVTVHGVCNRGGESIEREKKMTVEITCSSFSCPCKQLTVTPAKSLHCKVPVPCP